MKVAVDTLSLRSTTGGEFLSDLHPPFGDDVNPRSTLIFVEISPSAGVTMAPYNPLSNRKLPFVRIERGEGGEGGRVEAKFNLPVKEKLKRLSAYRGSWRARARAETDLASPGHI